MIRHLCTDAAALVQVSAICRVGWEIHLGHGEPSAATSVIAVVGVALFWVAWCDLRAGRSRRLSRPLMTRAWPRWKPSTDATGVPTAPVVFLGLMPFAIWEFVWMTQSNSAVRAASGVVALVVWYTLWKSRSLLTGVAFARLERVLTPVSSAMARVLIPTWWLVRVSYAVTGMAALILLSIFASSAADNEEAVRSFGELGMSFLMMHAMFGFLLWQWSRPTRVRVMPTAEILGDMAIPAVERRVEVAMRISGCISIVAVLLLA